MSTVVEMKEVWRRYPGQPPVDALANIDLRVEKGELVGIVGPSGSGKSTLLNLLGVLDRADSGTVRIAGLDISKLDDREVSGLRAHHIGFVFQQFFLSPGLTALDNVANGLLYSGIGLSGRRARAAAALERVGLGDRFHHRPSAMSGGQRQRVAVARAVVGQPALLLADEPTGALDSASGGAVLELLHDLHRAGTTVIVITHDHDVAATLPRRLHIRDGRIADEELDR